MCLRSFSATEVEGVREVNGMISIAVCDDEIFACCQIAGKIRKFLDDRGVAFQIRQFYKGNELLQAKEHFDIIFLDILMDELDGMETAEAFRKKKKDALLIFVTSSRKYVYDAYDVEAFQYLVKPVDDGKLFRVLERAVQKKQPQEKEFIVFQKGQTKVKLPLEDICYIESQGRQLLVHTTDGVISFYGKMGEIEEKLQEKDFFRCHKSYLVHLRFVRSYDVKDVVLDNGERVVVAKKRQEEFRKAILAYMRKKGGIV